MKPPTLVDPAPCTEAFGYLIAAEERFRKALPKVLYPGAAVTWWTKGGGWQLGEVVELLKGGKLSPDARIPPRELRVRLKNSKTGKECTVPVIVVLRGLEGIPG